MVFVLAAATGRTSGAAAGASPVGWLADLAAGHLLEPGSATLDAAAWGAELAVVLDWEGHSPEALQGMRDHLAEIKQLGIEAMTD